MLNVVKFIEWITRREVLHLSLKHGIFTLTLGDKVKQFPK